MVEQLKLLLDAARFRLSLCKAQNSVEYKVMVAAQNLVDDLERALESAEAVVALEPK